MTDALLIFAGLYVYMIFTWLVYVAGMHLKKVRHELRPFARYNAYVFIVMALLFDWAFNLVIGTIALLEWPRPFAEPLFTARLKRHRRGWLTLTSDSSWLDRWRLWFTEWFCDCLLNPFDADHCYIEEIDH